MYSNFKSLSVSGWRQFENISIDFHPRLTVITGANGAGKSSILNLLTQHLGWHRNFLGVPRKKRRAGRFEFSSGLRRNGLPDGTSEVVGNITYENGSVGHLRVSEGAQQYNVNIENQQPVVGTFIASHRPVTFFRAVTQINTQPFNADAAYGMYQSESQQRFQGQNSQSGGVYRLKETLVSLAVLGPASPLSAGDEVALAYYYDFIEVLRIVLPGNLGFKNISIRQSDVVIETSSGSFLIDAASGGVVSLVDLAWQIYAFSQTTQAKQDGKFVVVMDEPENHLHPSMQRVLLNSLLHAFPQAQFIVATHSPFMVSSVKDSSVYALRYMNVKSDLSDAENEDLSELSKRVFSENLDVVNRAGSAAEILRDVLGVPVTIPLWVEDQLSLIIDEYRDMELTPESIRQLRSRMAELGFDEMYPAALAKVVQNHD